MEQYRQALMQEAKNTTVTMQDTMKSLERQAGKMSEEFGNAISQEQERMKNTSKKLFQNHTDTYENGVLTNSELEEIIKAG